MEYLDFEVEIDEGRGGDYRVSVLQSPVGQTRETTRFPFSPEEFRNRLELFHQTLIHARGGRDMVPKSESAVESGQQAARELGRALSGALLAGQVGNLYAQSLAEARSKPDRGLRLKLRTLTPELAGLPWELLLNPWKGNFVCLSNATPLIRYLPSPDPPKALAVRLPLRILGMVASPKDLPALDVGREKARIEEAIADPRSRGLVDIVWLQGQTPQVLHEGLEQGGGGPWHIFHFIGHGGFHSRNNEGYLALAEKDGRSFELTASGLGDLLGDHPTLRLAVLNACGGAKGGGFDLFASTAATLVLRGLPAVVSMQHEISDTAAIELARELYRKLAMGYPVDAALAEARKAVSIALPRSVEWGTPVLHMRSPDGKLFDINENPPPPPPPQLEPIPQRVNFGTVQEGRKALATIAVRRDLANIPPAVLALITGLGALIALLSKAPFAVWLTLGAMLMVSVALLKKRSWRASRIVRPDLFLSGTAVSHLQGRTEEVQRLAQQCHDSSVVFLVGEPGVGKTALLREGLLPVLREDHKSRLVPVYIDTWRNNPDIGPWSALGQALWQVLSAAQRENLELRDPPRSPDELFAALRRCRQRLSRTPLIVFDQFDDYEISLQLGFLPGTKRVFRGTTDLAESSGFWREIKGTVSEGAIHLLFVGRSAEAEWLTAMRFGDSTQHTVYPLDSKFVRALVDHLSSGSTEAPAAISRPERGWSDLKERLISDLTSSSGVLPVQVALALEGITHLPALTIKDYVWAGGLRGLEAYAIEARLERTAARTRIDLPMLQRALKTMVNPATRETVARTTSEIEESLGILRLPDSERPRAREALSTSLEELERYRILRRSLASGRTELLWLLYHEHLCQPVLDAGSAHYRWSILLERKHRTFERVRLAATPWRWWWSLLSPWQQIGLAYQHARGRLTYTRPTAYAAWSLLRFTPYGLAVAGCLWVATAECGWRVPGGGAFRDWVYANEISVCERRFSQEQIEIKAHSLRVRLVDTLRARVRDSWYQPGPSSGAGTAAAKEPWVQGQAVIAILRAPEHSASDFKLAIEVLRNLYGDRITSSSEEPYGWLTFQNSSQTTAEPTLWAAAANAKVFRRLDNPAQIEFTPMLRFSQQAAGKYYVGDLTGESGAWNMFPNQDRLGYHSTYTAALALLALLETKAADLPWDAPSSTDEEGRRRRDMLLEQTAAWLTAQFVDAGARSGWRASNQVGDSVVLGLTFQIYSELLRSEAEAGVRLPPAILTSIPGALRELPMRKATAVSAPFEQKSWSGVVFRNHQDSTTMSDLPTFRYLWYPWSVDVARRWLDRLKARREVRSADIALAKRSLDQLIMVEGDKEVIKAVDPRGGYTFMAAELLYGLADITSH